MNYFDKIKPEYSVVVWYTDGACDMINLEFARPLGRELTGWLRQLKEQPFVKFCNKTTIYLNRTYPIAQIAEAIARSLEEEHGLTVSRQLASIGTTGKRSVERFAEL